MPTNQYYSSKETYFNVINEIIAIYGEDESRQLTKMLMEDLFSISFEKILIDEQIHINDAQHELLNEKVGQLKNFMPIQYVLGKANFFGREFYVSPSVLIPRQETEELINEILLDNRRPGLSVLDIGAGSGCIGLTLGLELKSPKISCLDIDEDALDVTRRNAENLGVMAHCQHSDILSAEKLNGKYDIIVSNPPYVTESEKQQMQNNVLKHEPEKALFVPDNNPLLFYKKIIDLAKESLLKKGKIYFEINENFGLDILQLCEQSGCSFIKLIQDIHGKDRIIKAMFD